VTLDPGPAMGLQERLQTAMVLLPPILGGAPRQPLEVGRASRVITGAQRAALAVRDGGGVFPDCDRPLAWCEGHHLVHWVEGGPTDLANLALLCRAHHRAIHEGGWQLTRGPDGRFSATPPASPTPSTTSHRRLNRPQGRGIRRRPGGGARPPCQASEWAQASLATAPGERMAPERPRPCQASAGGPAHRPRSPTRIPASRPTAPTTPPGPVDLALPAGP
jgi:hypothetical protein